MPRRPRNENRKKLQLRDIEQAAKIGRKLTQMYTRLFPDAADRLWLFRKNLSISQRQLAEECELSAASISRIETGSGLPKGTTLLKLGKGIGVSSDYLLTLSSKPEITK